jgi:hypothetical protein
MSRKTLRALAVALSLSGCAHVQFTEQPPPSVSPSEGVPVEVVESVLGSGAPGGASLIVLYRSSAYEGRLTTFSLRVDGVTDVDMANGTRAVVAVNPGPVTVRAAGLPNIPNLGVGVLLMDRPVLSFTAQPGMAHFIAVSPGVEGGPHLTAARPEAALAEAQRLRSVRAP